MLPFFRFDEADDGNRTRPSLCLGRAGRQPSGRELFGGNARRHRQRHGLRRFQGGKRCLLELCMFAEGSEYQEEITVVGDRGKIECFVPGPRRFWPENLGEAPRPKLVFSPRFPKGSYAKEIPVSPKAVGGGRSQRRHFLPAFQIPRRFERAPNGRGPDLATA